MRIVLILLLGLLCLPFSAEAHAVEITYLGTNSYLVRAPGATLLIDPYFTRLPSFRAALNLTVRSDPERVAWALRKGGVPNHVDGILVTHGHIDHLLDVPPIARDTGARIIASHSSVALCQSMDVALPQLQPACWGDSFQVGSARVTVLAASHDRIIGRVPFRGEQPRRLPPIIASDWVCGKPLAFLIEVAGKRIYVDSGGTPGGPIPRIGQVDLAIVGVALPDARARLGPLLQQLRPRYFLPSHQDNFFRPLERGFSYGVGTDARQVREFARHRGQAVISLPYFQPWVLR